MLGANQVSWINRFSLSPIGVGDIQGGGVGTQVRNEVGVWKVPGLSPKRKEVLEGAGF